MEGTCIQVTELYFPPQGLLASKYPLLCSTMCSSCVCNVYLVMTFVVHGNKPSQFFMQITHALVLEGATVCISLCVCVPNVRVSYHGMSCFVYE